MRTSLKLILTFLFFNTSLFAIGDGPRFELSHILTFLGILLLLFVVFVFLLYKFKILRKIFLGFVFISFVLSLGIYFFDDYKSYKNFEKYEKTFCNNSSVKDNQEYLSKLVSFKKEILRSENIFVKLFDYEKKINECINENTKNSKDEFTKAMVELLVNKNYKKAKDTLYSLSTHKNYKAAYYYYLLTNDACAFYYKHAKKSEAFEKVCKNKVLKDDIDDKTIKQINWNIQNKKQNFNVQNYYIVSKENQELSFQLLKYEGSKEGKSNALYSVHTNKGELIKDGLTNKDGMIFFRHIKDTRYYKIAFNINTKVIMSVIELEK